MEIGSIHPSHLVALLAIPQHSVMAPTLPTPAELLGEVGKECKF